MQCRLRSPPPIPNAYARPAAHPGSRNRFLAAIAAAAASAISRTRRRASTDWLSALRVGGRRRAILSASRARLRDRWSGSLSRAAHLVLPLIRKAEAHCVFGVVELDAITQCCVKRVFMLSDQISEQQFS